MGRRLKGGAAFLVLGLGALGTAIVIAPGAASAGTPIPPPTGAVVVGVAGQYCPSPSFSTIQSAITAVSAGATIYVCAGTYGESLTIDKPITLDGAQFGVDARSRDGAFETVIDAGTGIVYGAGATGGTLSGFTLSGYSGTTAVVQATGTGSGWAFTDDIVDASGGGIALNTAGAANPAPTLVKDDLFDQATPSAATSGDAGKAVMLSGGTANNVQITEDSFQNLSGPGAAVTTPGTAACGAALDSTNFSENLLLRNDLMSEDGASFTDPVNGPGFIDEPFANLQCTNDAQVLSDSVSVTDSADAHAASAIELTGGDWSTSVTGDTLSGDGAPVGTGVALSAASYPWGTGIKLGDDQVSGYGNGITVAGGSGFSVVNNSVKGSATDGIDVTSSGGGTLSGNAVSGSGTDDCADASVGSQTAATADLWAADGGATSAPAGLCSAFTLPAVTSPAVETADVGTSVSVAVTSSGYPAPKLTVRGLPPGLTFSDNGDGTGTIAGVLAPNRAGPHKLRVRATNVFRSTTNVATQILVLQADRAAAVKAVNTPKIRVGVPYRFVVRTVGYPAPSLQETGALPPGLSFTDNGNGTGTVAGTPQSPLGAPTFAITVSATNSVGSGSQQFVLSTSGSPATFVGKLHATAVVGQPFDAVVTATSTFGTPVLTEVGALPTGLGFVDDHNGTATVSGTVAAGAATSYRVVIEATTPAGTTAKPFVLLVESAPAFSSAPTLTVPLGGSFRFSVVALGDPVPALVESGTLPPGVAFAKGRAHGVLSGQPTATGSWTVQFTATNIVGSATQSFTLVVR